MQTERRVDADYLNALMGALPAGALVIDGGGTIQFATPHAAEVVGIEAEDLVGRSVLEFVSEETAWMYAAAVAMATDYPDVVMGPLRVTLIAVGGRETRVDLWATDHTSNPQVNGIVCLVTPETAAVWLGEAVDALATDLGFAAVADRVVIAMRGHPVTADAVLLDPSADADTALAAAAVPPELCAGYDGSPWQVAALTGIRQLHPDLASLPDGLRWAAEAAGYGAVWAEPVVVRDVPQPVALVMWRRTPGNPSPNELSTIHQAAGIVALAWERENR